MTAHVKWLGLALVLEGDSSGWLCSATKALRIHSACADHVIPVRASLSLNLALGDIGGDFDLDFPLAPQALPAPADTVFSLGEVDRGPRPLARLHPLYPYHARVKGLEGSVVVEFSVGPDGIPCDIRVVASQPAALFDAAACQAIRRWRFKPGTRGGQPVRTRMRQKVTFRLEQR